MPLFPTMQEIGAASLEELVGCISACGHPIISKHLTHTSLRALELQEIPPG